MILIIAAMEKECLSLISLLNLKKTEENIYKNGNIALICSGIGKVNAAIACQEGIDRFAPDLIFNYGFAGSMSKNCHVGDFVRPKKTLQHDFIDLTEDGFKPYFVSGQARSDFDFAECEDLKKYFPDLKECDLLLSGDRFVTEKIPDFDDAICDMEGYAIARCADRKNIPVVCIKFVTDSCVSDQKCEYFTSVSEFQKKMQYAIAEFVKSL